MLEDAVRKEINDLIKKGLLQEALDKLELVVDKEKSRSIKHAFREIQARYQQLKRSKQLNLLTQESLIVEQSRLTASLQDILDLLQDPTFTSGPADSSSLAQKIRHVFSPTHGLPWRVMVLSFLMLVICVILNYTLQGLALDGKDAFYSRPTMGGLIIIAVLAVLGSVGLNARFFKKQLGLIRRKTSKNQKKVQRLEQQYKEARKAKKVMLFKQYFIPYIATIGILFFTLYLTTRCYQALGQYELYTQQVANYEIEREGLQGNTRPKPEYKIVLNSIGQVGTMAGKIDLYTDLLSDLNEEIKTYNLPIEVLENLDEPALNKEARRSKGLYLIEGHYNDYRARLTVTDRTIYKTSTAYAEEMFGLTDSTSLQQYPRQPVEEKFTSNDRREYQISTAIPKQLKYFQMKMIAELMYKELLATYRDKDIERRRRLQNYMEGTLRIAEKNLIFQTNWWGFAPRPLTNLDASKLFLLLSNVYRVKANDLASQSKKGSEHYAFNTKLIDQCSQYLAHAKDCHTRASLYFDLLGRNNFEELLLYVQDYQIFSTKSYLNTQQAFNAYDEVDATIIAPKLKPKAKGEKIIMTSVELRTWEASIDHLLTTIASENSLFKEKHDLLRRQTKNLSDERNGLIGQLISITVDFLIKSTEAAQEKAEKRMAGLKIKKNGIMYEAGLK